MNLNFRNSLLTAASFTALLFAAGCHKKEQVVAPPPPPMSGGSNIPTASITATPSTVDPGQGVVLNWTTTNATDVSIDGIGAVNANGTTTVNPTVSTTYHLVAKGDGGSTDASARVTVGTGLGTSADLNANNGNMTDEAAFRAGVQDVFFDYDSYEISSQSQAAISKTAGYLNAHPNAKVVIGGYCDERGSTEFNLGLGESRANAAKTALVQAGVSAARLRTISYGKEKQFCTDHDESCWQQNRRAQFSLDR